MNHMRFILIVSLASTVAPAAVVIRSGCDEADSPIATVAEDAQIRVNSAIAAGSVCYSITAVVGQQKIDGYTVDSKLPAVVVFETERRLAFAKSRIEAGKPAAGAVTSAEPPPARFPDFATHDLRGKPLTLSAQRGKLIVVAFWSPSNRRTLAQLTSLRGVYDEFHSAGLDAIGVAMTSNDKAARAALDDVDLNWPQISDQMGLARSLNIANNEARTFVLDANRNIVSSDLQGPKLTAFISKMLQTSQPRK
jgi:peroxiredoxin